MDITLQTVRRIICKTDFTSCYKAVTKHVMVESRLGGLGTHATFPKRFIFSGQKTLLQEILGLVMKATLLQNNGGKEGKKTTLHLLHIDVGWSSCLFCSAIVP